MKKLFLIFLWLVLGACASKPTIGKLLWESANRNISDDLFLITPYFPNPNSDPQNVYLSNLNGEIMRTWKIRGPLQNSKLGPKGWVYSLRLAPFESRLTFAGGECTELVAVDENNVERLNLQAKVFSHDFDFVGDDKIAIFRLQRIGPKELRKFVPKTKKEFAYTDIISVLDFSGTELWSWHLSDHVAEIEHSQINDDNSSLSNSNSIKYIESNPITKKPAFLVSIRNLDVVTMVEYPSGKIIWQTPPNNFSRQHDAILNGQQVILFNNNLFSEAPTFEILAFDIFTRKRTLLWSPSRLTPQTTVFAGGFQILSNGNYLISNSMSGQLIELNPSGQMLWSYLVGPSQGNRINWLLGIGFFRAEVYTQAKYKEFLKGK